MGTKIEYTDLELDEDLKILAGVQNWRPTWGTFEIRELSLADLTQFGTTCGSKPNRPFDQETLDYLRKIGAKRFRAVLMDNQTYNEWEIQALVIVGMTDYQMEKFQRLVCEKNGSLRGERLGKKYGSRVQGFESE